MNKEELFNKIKHCYSCGKELDKEARIVELRHIEKNNL